MDAHDGTTFNYALLPAELLQVVGGQLCSRDLRHARLVCVGWATALAHSMPAVTVALPRQASERIFRQPLVLCSSGVLNSAQSRDYSAIPRQAPAHAPVLGRRRSCRHSHDGSSTSSGSPGCGAACKRACTGSGCSSARRLAAARSQTEPGVCPLPPQQQVDEEAAATSQSQAAAEAAAAVEAQQPVSRDKPSPFATEMGQAVLDCLLEDPLLAAGSKQVSCSAATAAAPAAAGASTAVSSIPKLPRMGAIKAAISMPPTLAEQAAATQQQQAMQPDAQHMRKLSSLPASSARPVPRTRHVSKPAASQPQQQQAPPAGPHHVVTTQGPAIQGWSSLPSAGLRTCSSLKQLHLKLSGAPPSPDDLLDLSKLMHLTHLSFKQVDEPDQQEQLQHTTLQEDSAELHCSSSSEPDHVCLNAPPAASTAVCSKDGHCTAGPSGVKRSHSTGPVRLQASVGGLCSDVDAATAAAACALEGCHIHGVSPAACMHQLDDTPAGWAAGHASGSSSYLPCSSSEEGTPDACMLAASDWQQDGAGTAAAGEGMQEDEEQDEEGCVLGSDGRMSAQSISCSVITPEHVAALAQLPHLSSLELAPKAGLWDAVSREGLLHLVKLTGLTRLSITWGDAAAAAGPLSAEDAAAAAQGEQLPLQKCLAGLTSLQELCINGAAVADVAVLQRLQQLRCLTAEGLQVIHSDVMTLIAEAEQQQQLEQQQQQAEADQQQEASTHGVQPVLSAAAAAPAGPQPAAAAQGSRWASLPHLQYVHAVHPTSDISLLLQSTVTPQLSHLGFVTRGPSDFARLLGQHGKLRTLHLAFAEEEPWHPIAVVRLPTALPSLRSLTIDGGFWLPNSLIVALGVMDVPLEHLSLTCKLAPPCLQRLQHLKQLKRLALHHVPPAAGSGEKNNAMLQLPAKLLPPQLQELEISNGWILH